MGKALAIKGHQTRGKEVIELLEMMGGKNGYNLKGLLSQYAYYFIGGPHNVEIRAGEYIFGNEDMYFFTIEEFLEKYPFKIGDKVTNGVDFYTIKSMSWSKDYETMVYDFEDSVIVLAAEDIKSVNNMSLKIGGIQDMETKVESTGFMQLGKTFAVIFNDANYEDEVELQLGNYEIEVRDGKTYAVKKKPVYPKTYAECCRVLGISDGEFMFTGLSDDEYDLFDSFVMLKRCRDAYWKMAGEQMGLGKPWEPDWNNSEKGKHCIFWDLGDIDCDELHRRKCLLAFPTEEMRDAFYENFKELIEQCKELL